MKRSYRTSRASSNGLLTKSNALKISTREVDNSENRHFEGSCAIKNENELK